MASAKIEIDGREIELTANGATAYIYKRIFNRDLMRIVPDILNMFTERGISLGETLQSVETWNEMESEEGKALMIRQADTLFPALSIALEAGLGVLLEEVAFVMAMQATESLETCLKLSVMDFIKWMEGFPPEPFLMKFMDIGRLYFDNMMTSVQQKNIPAPQREK